MMSTIDRARKLLEQAEAELRGLMVEAASAGDYTSVVQVAAWARSLTDIGFAGEDLASERPPREPEKSAISANAPSKREQRSARGNGGYPRFLRQGDRLVRVSWSKRERKEYEHRAPFAVVRAVADAISRKGGGGRVFSTDEILPVRGDDGGDIPSYQVYAAIALLKQVGLIDQHGRQGYSVPRLPELKDAVDAVWQNLPEK